MVLVKVYISGGRAISSEVREELKPESRVKGAVIVRVTLEA